MQEELDYKTVRDIPINLARFRSITAMPSMATLIGRVKNRLGSPRERVKALRRFSSSIGPSGMPSTIMERAKPLPKFASRSIHAGQMEKGRASPQTKTPTVKATITGASPNTSTQRNRLLGGALTSPDRESSAAALSTLVASRPG